MLHRDWHLPEPMGVLARNVWLWFCFCLVLTVLFSSLRYISKYAPKKGWGFTKTGADQSQWADFGKEVTVLFSALRCKSKCSPKKGRGFPETGAEQTQGAVFDEEAFVWFSAITMQSVAFTGSVNPSSGCCCVSFPSSPSEATRQLPTVPDFGRNRGMKGPPVTP